MRAGGAAAASGSHTTTCLSGAEHGPLRSESCGGAPGKACEWKHPRALTIELLFRDERATSAALDFLWETKVGGMTDVYGTSESGVNDEKQRDRG